MIVSEGEAEGSRSCGVHVMEAGGEGVAQGEVESGSRSRSGGREWHWRRKQGLEVRTEEEEEGGEKVEEGRRRAHGKTAGAATPGV